MATDAVRIGVIGAGWFASRRHLPEAKDLKEIQIVALCRRDPEMLNKIADHFQVAQRYTDYREMLDREKLDAVLVCTPHHLHYEHIKASLERGLHVITEKPMTLRGSEAWELVDLARSKGLTLLVSFNPPYWRHDASACRLLAEGWIGELEAVTSLWTANAEHVFGRKPMPGILPGVVPPTLFRADPQSTGGGHFADAGAHMVSEILWVTCRTPVSVFATMDDSVQDMRCSLTLWLQKDVPCSLLNLGNSGMSDKRFRTSFYGKEATLLIDGPPHVIRIEKPKEPPVIIEERRMDPVPTPMKDFFLAVREGRQVRSPGEHGALVAMIMEAAYESARTGRRVEIRSGSGKGV